MRPAIDDFERIFLVKNYDRSAGLCVHMTYALNGIKFAIEKNWLPVIQFDQEWDPFYEPERGGNVWDYYFEPPLGYTHADVTKLLDSGEIDPARVVETADFVYRGGDVGLFQDLVHWGRGPFEGFDRIATFPWGDRRIKGRRLEKWLEHKRALGREFTGRYIKVKEHVLEKVSAYHAAHMRGHYVIGAHLRGTDFNYASPTMPQRYFSHLDRVFRSNDAALVFLATDQEQYHRLFREHYGERVLSYDCVRAEADVATHQSGRGSPYQLGEEALIDCLLLSRTDHLLKCAASAGEYALYFNPGLDTTDFALESRWIRNPTESIAFDRWKLSRRKLPGRWLRAILR